MKLKSLLLAALLALNANAEDADQNSLMVSLINGMMIAAVNTVCGNEGIASVQIRMLFPTMAEHGLSEVVTRDLMKEMGDAEARIFLESENFDCTNKDEYIERNLL